MERNIAWYGITYASRTIHDEALPYIQSEFIYNGMSFFRQLWYLSRQVPAV
jgi:hypothetical protein